MACQLDYQSVIASEKQTRSWPVCSKLGQATNGTTTHYATGTERVVFGLCGAGIASGLALLLHQQSRSVRAQASHTYEHLMGTWIRDKEASDSFENAMKVMQINPFLKTAMRQLKGIRLEQTDDAVVLHLLSRFPWFKLQERYPWSGHSVQLRRRDFRPGKASGALSQDADALWIEQVWRDPVGGHGSECAWSPEPGTLYVDSTIQVQG
ncbi:hypothetical protein WJX77_003830 [Trebouxia sp. C0004]